jgi:hypothetical protein
VALRNLRSRLSGLKKKLEKGSLASAWDRRQLASILAGCIETAEPLLDAGQTSQALDLYTLLVDFAPVPAAGHFGRARAFAKMDKNKEALAEAKAAVAAGLPSEALQRAPELQKSMQKEEWQALLTK